jgi:hypothetical protein
MGRPSGFPASDMANRVARVLSRNDLGGGTKAAPDLYPHQWSWDTGFIAVGLANLDTARAARGLLTLFEHQWKNGMVPHIVFSPEAPAGLLPSRRALDQCGRVPGCSTGPAIGRCIRRTFSGIRISSGHCLRPRAPRRCGSTRTATGAGRSGRSCRGSSGGRSCAR